MHTHTDVSMYNEQSSEYLFSHKQNCQCYKFFSVAHSHHKSIKYNYAITFQTECIYYIVWDTTSFTPKFCIHISIHSSTFFSCIYGKQTSTNFFYLTYSHPKKERAHMKIYCLFLPLLPNQNMSLHHIHTYNL